MQLDKNNESPIFSERIIEIEGIHMKVVDNKDTVQVVIFCPGFPESKKSNDKIIEYISSNHNVSCIYPQYKGTWDSEGEFLEHNPTEDIEKIIEQIRLGNIINKKDSHITLIGSSFGGGVALSLSRHKEIEKVIALSPLTNKSGSVDRNSLHDYIINDRPEYKINNTGYGKLTKGKLFKIPHKYPEGKVTIGAVEGDQKINFENLMLESEKKKASTFDKISLDQSEEQRHLSRNTINRSSIATKEQLFGSLGLVNERINFISLFLESLFEKIPEQDVHSVLSHGSWLFQESDSRDFDFILVLNNLQENDLETLQHIKSKFLDEGITHLDITIIYKDKLEVGGVDNFNLSTHGNYYSEVLSKAKILYGENPFDESTGELTKSTISHGFLSEVGKYTDRLNRIILGNAEPAYFRKYIERMVLSLALSQGITTTFKSNHFKSSDVPSYLKRLGFDTSFIEEINGLLDKEYRDGIDRSRCYYLYNTFHFKSLEFSKITIDSNYLVKTLSKLCDIRGDVSVSHSHEKVNITEPNIKIISCAGFKKGSWNKLEPNQEDINNDQLHKLAQINIVLGQIKEYFMSNYGKYPGIEVLFGDYGVSVENQYELTHQYQINEKACTRIFPNISFNKLSSDFGEPNYETLDEYKIEDMKKIMQSYDIDDTFIDGYLKPITNQDQRVLNMIGLSISEHANLSEQIINNWSNSILIYIGNSQKIRLMNEMIKNADHTNILVGINT